MGATSPGQPQPMSSLARRPAVLAAALFMVGIGVHAYVPHRPALWVAALAALLLLGWRASAWISVSIVSLALAMIIAGIAAAQVKGFFYPRDHVSAFASDEPRLAQVEMDLIQPPRIITTPPGAQRPLPPKQVTTGRIRSIKTKRGWEPASGDVLVQIHQPHPRLSVGQTVRVLGMLQRPAPAMNPGQFDWAKYYREQRILASLQIPEA